MQRNVCVWEYVMSKGAVEPHRGPWVSPGHERLASGLHEGRPDAKRRPVVLGPALREVASGVTATASAAPTW